MLIKSWYVLTTHVDPVWYTVFLVSPLLLVIEERINQISKHAPLFYVTSAYVGSGSKAIEMLNFAMAKAWLRPHAGLLRTISNNRSEENSAHLAACGDNQLWIGEIPPFRRPKQATYTTVVLTRVRHFLRHLNGKDNYYGGSLEGVDTFVEYINADASVCIRPLSVATGHL